MSERETFDETMKRMGGVVPLRGCDTCGRILMPPDQPHAHPDPAATKREWLEDEARMFGYKDRADMDANFVADLCASEKAR